MVDPKLEGIEWTVLSGSRSEMVLEGDVRYFPHPSRQYITLNFYFKKTDPPILVLAKIMKRDMDRREMRSRLSLFILRIPPDRMADFKTRMSDFQAPVSPTPRPPDGLSLVTGATGFIGGSLALRLAQAGAPVRLLVRNEMKARRFASFKNVEIVIGDLREAEAVERAVRGAQFVFHCGGLVTDWGPRRDFFEANAAGTAALVKASLGARLKRFVHVSTTDVYGYPEHPEQASADFRETGLPYTDSKQEGEKKVREAEHAGLPVTVVRPATVFGPRSETIVREFVDTILRGEMLYIGRGTTNAGLVYVENLVDVLLSAACSARALGKSYDITDGWPITWRDYVTTLAAILKKPAPKLSIPYRVAYAAGWLMEKVTPVSSKKRPLLTRMAVHLLGRSQEFSRESLRTDLSDPPRVSFAEAIAATEEWILANPTG